MHDFQQHQTHHAFPAASDASVSAFPTPTNLDVREVVWTKLQALKDKYIEDMKELYGILTQRSTLPMPSEQLQKVTHYKEVVQRMIPYMTVPKERLPLDFNEDKVEAFEKQIVNILETFRRRKPTLVQQPGPLSQQQLHPNERLQSVQQEHAQQQRQLLLQRQQEILQRHQQMLEQILQYQQEIQKNLLHQQQLFQQQQNKLQEQQQQEDMIEAMTGCLSKLPLN